MKNTPAFQPLSKEKCTQRLNNVGDALYVIGGKWKLRIIIALAEGYRRFNDIQRAIDGISPKVLSSELKDLELNGFVKRHVDDGTPVVVTYVPTSYAETLGPVLGALAEWGERHREKLRQESR